jgi:methylglutaconyl-CoA hydratase
MSSPSPVLEERDARDIVRLTLNRDAVRNALSAGMMHELHSAFERLSTDRDVRAIVLTGVGRAFSAGADLDALAEVAAYSLERNVADSVANDALFRTIAGCPHPVIARVNGHAIGGGAALVACADIAVSSADAKFGFGEVRVGIVPAVISTFVVPKIGFSAARQLMLTGQQFDAFRALSIGLVHSVVESSGLDEAVEDVITEVCAAWPGAQREIKRLLNTWPSRSTDDYRADAIETAARVRFSDEGRAGLTAFVDGARKRAASRNPPHDTQGVDSAG